MALWSFVCVAKTPFCCGYLYVYPLIFVAPGKTVFLMFGAKRSHVWASNFDPYDASIATSPERSRDLPRFWFGMFCSVPGFWMVLTHFISPKLLYFSSHQLPWPATVWGQQPAEFGGGCLWSTATAAVPELVRKSALFLQGGRGSGTTSCCSGGLNMGLSENVVYPYTQSGFADHYPY